MAEFPALPLWTDAYLGDTTHLTTIEHGAYLLLLMTAWRSKNYDLPDDDKMLARFARLTLGQWLRIKPAISPYWRVADGRWSNGRLLDEVESVRRMAQQRSDAGKASALKRLHRGSTVVQRNGNENPTPTPNPTQPIKEVSKKVEDFSKSGVGGNGLGRETVTIKDPAKRLAIFQKKIAEAIPSNGWMTVIAAADPTAPGHAAALEICKLTAKKLGKGWPTQWPSAE